MSQEQPVSSPYQWLVDLSKERSKSLSLVEIENIAKEWGYPSLAKLDEDCHKSGYGFRERFERICGVLLGEKPGPRDEKYSP
jgi:hypothetical protein